MCVQFVHELMEQLKPLDIVKAVSDEGNTLDSGTYQVCRIGGCDVRMYIVHFYVLFVVLNGMSCVWWALLFYLILFLPVCV